MCNLSLFFCLGNIFSIGFGETSPCLARLDYQYISYKIKYESQTNLLTNFLTISESLIQLWFFHFRPILIFPCHHFFWGWGTSWWNNWTLPKIFYFVPIMIKTSPLLFWLNNSNKYFLPRSWQIYRNAAGNKTLPRSCKMVRNAAG